MEHAAEVLADWSQDINITVIITTIMNGKPLVRLVKKEGRGDPEIKAAVKPSGGPKRWSTAVLAWVSEFQERRNSENLRGVDSLFKEARPRSGRAD